MSTPEPLTTAPDPPTPTPGPPTTEPATAITEPPQPATAPSEPAVPARIRASRGELVSASSAILLLILMFAMKWYGVAGLSTGPATRAANSTSENAWNALGVIRWLMLATIAASVGAVALHFSQRGHGTQTDTSVVVTILSALTAVLVTYRVLIGLPAPAEVLDQKLGAVLGVFCTYGIAYGAFYSLRVERARARRLVQRSRAQPRAARGARSR